MTNYEKTILPYIHDDEDSDILYPHFVAICATQERNQTGCWSCPIRNKCEDQSITTADIEEWLKSETEEEE